MNDNQLETVAILAGLIQKARMYNIPLQGGVMAVPVYEIADILERFTTEQTAPVEPKNGDSHD